MRNGAVAAQHTYACARRAANQHAHTFTLGRTATHARGARARAHTHVHTQGGRAHRLGSHRRRGTQPRLCGSRRVVLAPPHQRLPVPQAPFTRVRAHPRLPPPRRPTCSSRAPPRPAGLAAAAVVAAVAARPGLAGPVGASFRSTLWGGRGRRSGLLVGAVALQAALGALPSPLCLARVCVCVCVWCLRVRAPRHSLTLSLPFRNLLPSSVLCLSWSPSRSLSWSFARCSNTRSYCACACTCVPTVRVRVRVRACVCALACVFLLLFDCQCKAGLCSVGVLQRRMDVCSVGIRQCWVSALAMSWIGRCMPAQKRLFLFALSSGGEREESGQEVAKEG